MYVCNSTTGSMTFGVPGPASNITLIRTAPTTIQLSWNPPTYFRDLVLGYTVIITHSKSQLFADPDAPEKEEFDGGNFKTWTNLTLADMEPALVYTAVVVTSFTIGRVESAPIVFSTLETGGMMRGFNHIAS